MAPPAFVDSLHEWGTGRLTHATLVAVVQRSYRFEGLQCVPGRVDSTSEVRISGRHLLRVGFCQHYAAYWAISWGLSQTSSARARSRA